ncbi:MULTISPECIES: cupin-like domain-containing protein [Ralstonia solanacearum species complex]|uniref:Cupin-like domain-containing protein n=2 Tax=Ralstonia solanacearum species complex TaxID=3116862 RepID=A0AAD0WGV1_RALSL|nr:MULTISPECIES: cupin-like domain-containing protein [Ralstonia solanacearum species complex]AXV81362.1 cupin-like domain-containing protein [Ralstonia solanacearum]AXW52498.1 cupin-like domain-containing protein [Ralstonia solanacearum]QUP53624.1 cupin-like domain-containing protein [Ralstonia syzygii]CBJ50948.1 putative peptide-aspartate beta-dioxygenase [Ralstonia solanacearum PSI07]
MTDQSNAEWMEWASYNLALGVGAGNIIEELKNSGFEAERAQSLVTDIQSHPSFKAAKKLGADVQKWESLSEALLELTSQTVDLNSVPRVRGLSSEEFHERYYSRNLPVLIEDAAHCWPALTKWTNAYLKEQYGDCIVTYQDRGKSSDHRHSFIDHSAQIAFSKYIELVENSGESNACYLIAHDRLLDRPEFASLLDDIPFDERYLDPIGPVGKVFFWLGPKGARTPLHRDLGNVFLAQVRGRKRVNFIPALEMHRVYNSFGYHSDLDLDDYDPKKFPRMAKAHVSTTVVSSGEMLFIPVGWWHHVVAIDECISITGNNFKFPNAFTRIF